LQGRETITESTQGISERPGQQQEQKKRRKGTMGKQPWKAVERTQEASSILKNYVSERK
jgi:hypothetical protein